MKRPKSAAEPLDEASLKEMALTLGAHPDNVEAILDDLAGTEALLNEAFDLGVAFRLGDDDLSLHAAFPKTMPSAIQKRLSAAISARSMGVAFVLDARENGAESALATMFVPLPPLH
jgi:hypothetical protein